MITPYRDLWNRRAETREGNETLDEARRLARMPEYSHLADGELIRLAYWGSSGRAEPENRPRTDRA
jgi:hypothetical protein